MSLQWQILIGMLLGVFTGLFFGDMAIVFDPLGKAFIMLLKMTIVPYLSVSLIQGIGSLSSLQAKKMFRKGAFFIVCIWSVTLLACIFLSNVFPRLDHPTVHVEQENYPEIQTSFLDLIIPVNPFNALANDAIPAVVLFSLLFGVALMQIQKKEQFLELLSVISDALMHITRWVSYLSPIGVFGLIATASGTLTLYEIENLWIYVFSYALGSIFLSFVLFPMLLVAFTRISYLEYVNALRAPLLLAFTTGNVLIILPFIFHILKDLSQKYGADPKESQHIFSTLVPILYNFPTAGNLFAVLFLFFLSSFYAQPFSWPEVFQVLSYGLFALFGSTMATINALSFLIDQMHLPHEGLGLYIQALPMTRHFQAVLSCSGIAAGAFLIHFSSKDLLIFRKKAFFCLCSALLAFCVLSFSIPSLFSFSSKEIDHTFARKRIDAPAPYTIVQGSKSKKGKYKGSSLARIKKEGVLRVGIHPEPFPFIYRNESSELVGYDIAFAHQLAKDLSAQLEFVPVSYKDLGKSLDNGSVDIIMAAVAVESERLKSFAFSESYLTVQRVLVTKDHRKNEFTDLADLRSRKDLRIAALEGSNLESLARKIFPHAQIVAISRYLDFSLREDIDALFWVKEEALPWTAFHPSFTVLDFQDALGKEFYAYPMAKDDDEFIDFVNYWMDLKKLDGFAESQYRYWILGKEKERVQRWSILKDVLHWVD